MEKKYATRLVSIGKMKVIICDDNRYFVDAFRHQIQTYSAYNGIEIEVQMFSDIKKLLQADLFGCDALFLDIEMPELNGIEAAHQLRQKYPDLILVFVTGWIKYAPAGYRVNAFRYLLKNKLSEELTYCIDDIRNKLFENTKAIVVHTRDCTIEISVKNIAYVEGTQRRSVVIHLARVGESLDCMGKLSDFETLLLGSGFLRLQRSYLVNMAYITRISNYYAILKDNTMLKVSERNYADVKKQFLMWKGKVL